MLLLCCRGCRSGMSFSDLTDTGSKHAKEKKARVLVLQHSLCVKKGEENIWQQKQKTGTNQIRVRRQSGRPRPKVRRRDRGRDKTAVRVRRAVREEGRLFREKAPEILLQSAAQAEEEEWEIRSL